MQLTTRTVSHAKQLALIVGLAVVALACFALVDAEVFNNAWAASSGAAGPFDKANQKGTDLADLMKGKIAVTITTVIIAVVGILMQLNRISHMIGVRVILGVLIVGGAAGLAEWLYA